MAHCFWQDVFMTRPENMSFLSPRKFFKVGIVWCAVFALFRCQSGEGQKTIACHPITAAEIVKLIDYLPDWDDRHFRIKEWQKYIHAAKIIQVASQEEVFTAL